MAVLYDARGNELTGSLDAITGQTITDARTATATLGALNAESDTDINGHAAWLVDARTAAGNLTFIAEGSVDGVNYSTTPLPMYDTAAPNTAVTSVVITTTLAKQYYIPIVGWRRVRIRISAYTSGNVTIASRASMGSLNDVLGGTVAIGPTMVPGTGVTNLGKARAQALAGADVGVAALSRGLTANAAVTNGQWEALQLEAATGGLFVRQTPSTVNGLTIHHLVSAATTNATSVKASAGNVYGWSITNGSAAIKYVKLFNKASAPTVGTDVPVITIAVPTLSTVSFASDMGITFATGIALCIVGALTDLDATAVALNDVASQLFYK